MNLSTVAIWTIHLFHTHVKYSMSSNCDASRKPMKSIQNKQFQMDEFIAVDLNGIALHTWNEMKGRQEYPTTVETKKWRLFSVLSHKIYTNLQWSPKRKQTSEIPKFTIFILSISFSNSWLHYYTCAPTSCSYSRLLTFLSVEWEAKRLKYIHLEIFLLLDFLLDFLFGVE